VKRLISVLASLSVLVGGLVMATPAGASDTPIALATLPGGQWDVGHIVVDDGAGYVFLSTVNGLDVRDLAGAALTSLPLDGAGGLALSGDGATLYVAVPADHAIAVIDTGTLTETGRIATGDAGTPRTLALIGSTLWFGYDIYPTGGRLGVVDLSQPTPAVTAPVPIGNGAGSDQWWDRRAPTLLSSPAVPDTLFAGDASVTSGSIEKFATSGSTVTLAGLLERPFPYVGDMAVTGDGTELLVNTGKGIARVRISDLAIDGSFAGDNSFSTVAVAPDDGRLAVGNEWGGDQPVVYTYSKDGTFEYQYGYQSNSVTVPGGLAFNSTGSTLYAVTQAWQGTAPGGYRYELHVITNTHDTARPPLPEALSVIPDYRAITLTWGYPGLYDPAKLDSFTIYRGTAPDQLKAYTQLAATKAVWTSWVDTGVASGTTYYYAVTATNSAGESDRSATVSTMREDLATVYLSYEYSFADDNLDIVYRSDNGLTRRLTPTSGHYRDPAASPDGSTVAYALSGGGGTHLWLAQLPGGTAQQLTSGSAADSWPTWSPDGSRIAFTRTTSTGTSIWTVPAAGGAAVAIPGSAGDSQPAWSPSGRLLAVTDGTGAASRIVVTSLDGGYRRVVTGTNGSLPIDKCSYAEGAPGTPLCHYSGAGASWAPDGASLVFVQTTPSGTSPAIVPAAGGTVDYSLYRSFDSVSSVSWNLDGSRILWTEGPGGWTSGLWQIAPDGTGEREVGLHGAWADHPSVAAVRSAYTAQSHPGPVTGVSAALGTGAVTLDWARPAGTGYVTIRRSAPNGPAPATPTSGIAVYTGAAATATATGLANGSTYRFSIFSISPLGDAGASATVTAVPGAVPAVSPNGSVLGSLYGTGPAFTATWGEALPAGQVYDVQIGSRVFNATTHTWSATPAWSALLTGTTRSDYVVRATAGTTYYLRARIRDAYGHTTAWSAAATTPVPYDDRSAARTAGWTEVGATGRYEASLSTARQAGAALQWRTYGSELSIVADRCASCGQIRVYADGVLRSTVDTHASSTQKLQAVWRLRYAGIGLHTIRVVVVGTSGRPSIRIDGLVATR
jgi:hypothetical protein